MWSSYFIRRITAQQNFDERNDKNRNFLKLNSLLGQNFIKRLTALCIKMYKNQLLIFASMITSLLHSQLKCLALPLTFNQTLCMSTEASSLGILISFVKKLILILL